MTHRQCPVRASAARKPSTPRPAARHRRRAGFTLIEMMIVVVLALVLMLGMSQLYQMIGESVNEGRAMVELSGQVRQVANRLDSELRGVTVSLKPEAQTEAGEGYFEYIEGPGRDPNSAPGSGQSLVGDVDDVIAATVRSKGEPFEVLVGNQVVRTQAVEIVYWTAWDPRYNDTNGNNNRDANEITVTLFRRVLPVMPGNAVAGVSTSPLTGQPNSLADLTRRENRYLHANQFPHAMQLPIAPGTPDEVLLTNVLAFDVKGFDPRALVKAAGTEPLTPEDPGYGSAGASVGTGAYVDLNYTGSNTASPHGNRTLAAGPNALSLLSPQLATFCTWSFHYEHDGVDQPTAGPSADLAANGFDDNNFGGVDDVSERETMPPYPIPLRGLQVRLRVYESDTRQVRQETIRVDFVPE